MINKNFKINKMKRKSIFMIMMRRRSLLAILIPNNKFGVNTITKIEPIM